jgi:glutamyl-tRNA synthetase
LSFFSDDFPLEDGGRALLDDPASRELLAALVPRLGGLAVFGHEPVEALFRELAAERGVKPAKIIHPVRMAVSGLSKGAGLFEMMEVLGKETVLRRLRRAVHGSPEQA